MGDNFNEKVYKYCPLLKEQCVKDELGAYIKGYKLQIEEFCDDQFVFCFYEKGGELLLVIEKNFICLSKSTDEIYERLIINNNFSMQHKCIEKRKKGLIITNLEKNYTRFNNELILTVLVEKRMTYTMDTIKEKCPQIENADLFDVAHLINDLDNVCDFSTVFSTQMNNHIKKRLSSTRTYVDGEDVSKLYHFIEGADKLNIIYNLYRGIIDSKNEIYIKAIHLGLINTAPFDLKSLKGITEKEENLVGKRGKDYEFARQLLSEEYGYDGEIIDRNSILNAIADQVSDDIKTNNKPESCLVKTLKEIFSGPVPIKLK